MGDPSTAPAPAASTSSSGNRPLSLDEYARYGRQMIMPGFGLPGQLKLKAARVAVVGAGGLGCPVLQYLAGAGVGSISVFDHDEVSVSNLHRQVLHSTDRVGMNKARSAQAAIQSLNPHVTVHAIDEPITPSNARAWLTDHDMIVDCTDRPMTRYLLSDISVSLGLPLVSGAAISSAGQWAVYGGETSKSKDTRKGTRRACYRCLWPKMVNAGGNDRCEEMGVYGVITGMVGTGMASEVIKLLIGKDDEEPLLHLMHLGGNPLIRTIRMRPPSIKCAACGREASIRVESFDYDEFCAGALGVDEEAASAAGTRGERLGAKKELVEIMGKADASTAVIDTRPEIEFGICSIPNTSNVPLATILSAPDTVPESDEVVFICKQGNDSQLAAAALRKVLGERSRVRDVRGGLVAWAKEVDPGFPLY